MTRLLERPSPVEPSGVAPCSALPVNATGSSTIADRRVPWLFVIAVLALGFALRGWNLHGRGYTADEVAELLLARAPLASVVLDEDDDRFPPLYRTMLVLWDNLWGTELAARWLSVIAGALTIVVVWRAGAELLGERDAPWPALLLACSPFHIHFSREGRAYAVYCLFAAMMFWAALRLLRSGSRGNWAFMVAATVAAVYVHYYAVPLGAVLWSVVLLAAIRRDGWRAAAAAVALCTLLLIPSAVYLVRANADAPDEDLPSWFDLDALAYTYASLAGGFTVGPSMKELRSMPISEGFRQMAPWAAVIAAAGLALTWHSVRRIAAAYPLAMLLLSSAVLVPLLGIAGNVTGVGYVYRYVVWLAAPYALLMGAGAARSRASGTAAIATAALMAVNAAALYNRAYDSRYDEEDFRAVAEKLESLGAAEEPVLVASNYMGDALRYYWGDRRLTSFPIFLNQAEQREARIAAFLAENQPGARYWIVSQWLPPDDSRRETRDAALERLGAELKVEMKQLEIYAATIE